MSYMTTMGMLPLLLWLKGALHYVEQALALLLLVVHGSTLFVVVEVWAATLVQVAQ